MRLYTLQKQQLVRRNIDEVFGFFSKPENLAAITPPEMGFTILTPSPITMKEGALIDYTVKIMGFPVRWTTYISDFTPPHRFVDEQLRGPYSFWHHRHSFVETDDGTIIIDEIRYAVPFGILGTLLHSFLIRKQLDRIFEHRAAIINRIFSHDPASSSSNIPSRSIA